MKYVKENEAYKFAKNNLSESKSRRRKTIEKK